MSRRRPSTTSSTRTSRGAAAPATSRPRPRRATPPSATRASSPSRNEQPRRERRRLSKLSRVAVLFGVVVTVVTLGGQWLAHQSFLRVQHVTFVGLRHESEAQVLRASGLWAHPTMAGLSARSVQDHLARFAWIERVDVQKHWPNSVVVTVHETHAVAVAYDPHHVLRYVSATGRDLGAAPLQANLPTLSYEHALHPTWPYARAGRNAAYVASQLPNAFAAQVAQITVNARGAVTLVMTTPVQFELGPPTDLHAKFVAIASVIANATLRPGDVVDVSVPDELAVSGPAPS